MSKLQQQLKENKDKIKRGKFLALLDQELAGFLSTAEFSSDASCIKNVAFPESSGETNGEATTRGEAKKMNTIKFKTWQDLISVLRKFQKVKDFIGWFFVDTDGPYYRISLKAFFAHIEGISNYAVKHEHYNFGWVGSVDDIGIIVAHDHNSPGDKKFAISVWGI